MIWPVLILFTGPSCSANLRRTAAIAGEEVCSFNGTAVKWHGLCWSSLQAQAGPSVVEGQLDGSSVAAAGITTMADVSMVDMTKVRALNVPAFLAHIVDAVLFITPGSKGSYSLQ